MLIFLDFDGVLHPNDDALRIDDTRRPAAELHAEGLFRFNTYLVDALRPWPQTKIVVHSSWRLTHTLAEVRTLMTPLDGQVVGVTKPQLDREASILDYVRGRRLRTADFVILDDQPKIFQRLGAQLIVCDPNSGLSAPAVREALRRRLEESAGHASPTPECRP